MTTELFGYSNLVNENVFIYTIDNDKGMKVKILSFGAAVQSLNLPWSQDGSSIVLGFDDVEKYESNDNYLGVVIGRVAGRISYASFLLEGIRCDVSANCDRHCLHGGSNGIYRKNWTMENLLPNSVTLKCDSPDGEGGFPGNMEITVTYTLTSDNCLTVDYRATVDKHACPINLTNHSYFNLSGTKNVDRGIRDHVVCIQSSRTVELDENLLPTGKIIPLSTELDFRKSTHNLDTVIDSLGGVDSYYIFDVVNINLCQATVSNGVTKMSLFTDQKGAQLYTANFFDHVQCSNNFTHGPHGALCLEAQNYPDAVNHDEFPSIILYPGITYTQETKYKFEKI